MGWHGDTWARAMSVEPAAARNFALEVVRRIRQAGFEALWAGGCVRDRLLGLVPKDYDVATSATPDQIQQLFGHRRTLAIGASFGVISVRGGRREGQIEVATFRRDAAYLDGRHPQYVTFSTAVDDAQRRDFTINGLFYDPIEERVLDYVGGQEDLVRGVVRAIGDPTQRIDEDKLRMLRAVRFAATFRFALDPATLAAVQKHARQLGIVSAERVAAELRRMLVHDQRHRALELLAECELLTVILPEAADCWPVAGERDDDRVASWNRVVGLLEQLHEPSFAVALAALLREPCWHGRGSAGLPTREAGAAATEPAEALATRAPVTSSEDQENSVARFVARICGRWRLSKEETAGVSRILTIEPLLRRARRLAVPQLQRILVGPWIDEGLQLAQAVARVEHDAAEDLALCRERLALPRQILNPPPLVTGSDLIGLGIPRGPKYRLLLDAVRDAQIEGRIRDQAEAIALVRELASRE